MLTLHILLIDCTAIVWVMALPVQFIRNLARLLFSLELTRLKPFDCPLCMGFWLGLLHFGISFEGIGYACVCAFTSETLYRLFKLIPVSI